MSRYLSIIEETATGFSAYSPDLPGCIATGETRAEVEREMGGAVEFHISSATVPGLTSGTRYWFRVAGVGTAGQGAWSDPATKVAP